MKVSQRLWDLGRSLLFRLDAERVHEAALAALETGGHLLPNQSVSLPRTALGLSFLNPIGLAAGFDKNARLLGVLPRLGFGFAEIGTVTPRPQPGNPKPRLFRDPKTRSLFNCLGFNNDGAEVIARRIAEARPDLPTGFRIGVNIGKNRDTALDHAPRDYAAATEVLAELADYLVINVSSPNTAGLRSLQQPEALKTMIGAVMEVLGRQKTTVPVLVKLAPELEEADLSTVFKLALGMGCRGMILTNTLAGTLEARSGGWSGGRLTEIARARTAWAARNTTMDLISVGGILSPEEACARFKSGARLVEVYTGWIYGGPAFIRNCLEVLKLKNPGT